MSHMESRKKYRGLSNREKVKVIKDVESGQTKKEVAKKFGVTSSTIWAIIKNKDKLMQSLSDYPQLLRRKKIKCGKYEAVDKAVENFVMEAKRFNMPLSAKIIQSKAKEFGAELGFENFTASNGWFDRLRKRIGLKWRSDQEEPQEKLDDIYFPHDPDPLQNVDLQTLMSSIPADNIDFEVKFEELSPINNTNSNQHVNNNQHSNNNINISNNNRMTMIENRSNINNDNGYDSMPVITRFQIRDSIQTLRNGWMQRKSVPAKFFQTLDEMDKFLDISS